MVAIISMATIFNACKKQDIKSEEASVNADKATIEKVKAAIVANGQLVSVTIPVNEKASDVYFSDAENNRIDMRTLANNVQTNRVSVCDYQYDGNGDPIDDMFPANFNLNSTGFIYDCGSGTNNYRVSFEWGLAVHHSILEHNNFGAGGSAIRSRYTLKVKNSSGTIIATYTNNYLLSADIHDLGDWTTDPTRTLYQINASINVPTSVFTAGVTYETTLTLATDCNLTPQLSAVHTTTSISSLNSQPCKRTDKVWINPNSGAGGVLTAAGTFVVCTPPPGYTVTPNHQLQYRLKTSGVTVDSWDAQSSTIYPSSTTFYNFGTYTGVINLPGTPLGSGTWLVRYRNNNSCNPTAPWIVEKWAL